MAEETNSSYLFTLKNGRYDEFLDADSEAYNQPGEVFTKKKKLTLSAKKATGLSLQTWEVNILTGHTEKDCLKQIVWARWVYWPGKVSKE